MRVWGSGGGNTCSATLSLRYPVGAAAWLKPLHGGRLQVTMMENNEVGKRGEESSAFALVHMSFGGPEEQTPPRPRSTGLASRSDTRGDIWCGNNVFTVA